MADTSDVSAQSEDLLISAENIWIYFSLLLLLNIPLWVSQQPLHGASPESRWFFPFFIMGEFIYAENTVFARLPTGQYNKRFILNIISLKFHHRTQGFLLCSPPVAMKVSALSFFFYRT